MLGKTGPPHFRRAIRFSRISMRTGRRRTWPASTARRRAPRVVGNSEAIPRYYHAPMAQRTRETEHAWVRRARAVGRPLVLAHRGGAGLAPENTWPAFERAHALGV